VTAVAYAPEFNEIPPGIKLFPYQESIVAAAVEAFRRGDKEILIAACPGAGKTEMGFEMVRQLYNSRDLDGAVWLAWLRTSLMEATRERLQKRLPALAPHLTIEIPQQHHNIEGKFDLVVSDEGHANGNEVDGGQVSRLVKKTGARSTLILTGSPSKFIKRGLKPVAVFSLAELHAAGRSSDLTIEVGLSEYPIVAEDYNKDGDVRHGINYTQKQTDRTLENLLDGFFARLKLGRHSMGWWNRGVLKLAEKKWDSILTRLKKTIIACRDIKQAKQVAKYFRAQGVETLVSNYEEDKKSENMDAFSKSSAPLLIVVDRGTLGYDNPDLVNFVDFTGSRNPDRIFQMLSRVVRPSKKISKKLFIKVMPTSFADANLIYFMEGVLNLVHREIFSTYDGSGFYKGKVPTKTRKPGKGGRKLKGSNGTVTPVLEPGMSLFGPSGYFTVISHARVKGYGAIGQARLGDLVGKEVYDPDGAKAEVMEALEKGEKLSAKDADPRKRRLAQRLVAFTTKTPMYDPEFHGKVKALGHMTKADKAEADMEFLLQQWIPTHQGFRPRARVTSRELVNGKTERQWGVRWANMFANNPAFQKAVKQMVKDGTIRDGNTSDSKSTAIKSAQNKAVIDETTGTVYPSATEAARVLGLSTGNISACIAGTRKHTKGHTFRRPTKKEAAKLAA
jgi:superfamily II DNA or RNA helicase